MKLSPADFRDDTAMKKFTDGELFDIVTNGKGGIPPEGKRAARIRSETSSTTFVPSPKRNDRQTQNKFG
jgi:hypothetical protein